MELRKDYVLNRWVIIAAERKKRPREFAEDERQDERAQCFFCPGNEHLTPKEIGRVGGKKWKLRWFPNKFPAVDRTGSPKITGGLLTHGSAYGSHEIIVETPSPKKQLWDLSAKTISQLLGVYQNRIDELGKRTSYVAVYKNHGARGGASLKHAHSQVTSLNLIPPVVSDESTKGACPYCPVISMEKAGKRRCFENKHAVAFAPYASRYNYEVWLFPKKHRKTLAECTATELDAFANLLHKVLHRLKSLKVSYNYVLHYAPPGKNLHVHVEVTPRLSTWAGFETNTGVIINSVSPEDAAAFYRAEKPY
jgi:UDPglucose--hexose-1-phosphate uridylyltransferase